MAKAPKAKKAAGKTADSYLHPSDTSPMRPEIGTQTNFRKKKAPRTYRYDSSLSPTLEWDGQGGRELGEWLIGVIERASALSAPHVFAKPEEFKDAGGAIILSVSSLQDAVDALKRLSRPFLETKGFDDLAEVKAGAAQRWVAAVNADEQFGRWQYEMARAIPKVRVLLDQFL